MRGMFFPKQPPLNCDVRPENSGTALNEEWFLRTIKDKILHHPESGMEYPFYDEPIFDEPLVGFVRGNDPIFDQFKEIIGPHHFTPWEIMKWQADKNNVEPPKAEDISVVSFVMPITRNTKADNAAAVDWPSERWAQTRPSGGNPQSGQLFVKL